MTNYAGNGRFAKKSALKKTQIFTAFILSAAEISSYVQILDAVLYKTRKTFPVGSLEGVGSIFFYKIFK